MSGRRFTRWVLPLLMLGVLLLLFKPTRRAGASALCAMLIGLIVVNFTIKPLVARERPWLVMENFVNLVPEHDPNSFPSGHTNAAFAFAIAVCLSAPRRWMKLTAVCMAAVMGLSVLPGVPVWVSYWMVTAAALLTMSAATLFTVVLLTLVQSQVPPQLLGTVIACIQAVANCASPLGQAAYGVLFDSLPPWSVLLGAAALSALTALRSRRVFLRLETEAVPE